MFQIYGDRTQGNDGSIDFLWQNGIIDGNDENQGDENLDSWDNYDKCKGMKIVRFRHAELDGVTIREIRGHGVNHWNNKKFHAHDCIIDQSISKRKPEGGTRRDGIGGSSDVTIYERITGFAADDLVTLAVGAFSPPKGFSGWSTWDSDVELFIARDIVATTKKDHDGMDRYTWTAATIHLLNGYRVKEARLEGIRGETYTSLIRAGGYQEGYYGTIENLYIKDVTGDSYGDSDNACISLYGSPDSDDVFIDNVVIDNFVRKVNRSGQLKQNINSYYTKIKNLVIQNTHVEYGPFVTERPPIFIETGESEIEMLKTSGISIRDRSNPTNPALRIYSKITTNDFVTRYYADSLDMGPRDNSSTRRVFNVVGQGGVIPYGFEILIDYENGWVLSEPGAHCTDRMVGALLVDNGGSWKQLTKPTNLWNSSSHGKPALGLWKVGFENVVVSSPMGMCIGWRCISEGVGNGAVFVPIYPDVASAPGSLDIDWKPTDTNVTPGTVVSREIGAAEGVDYPGGQAGILTLYMGYNDSAWTYETYRRRDNGSVYTRQWQPASDSWTPFVS